MFKEIHTSDICENVFDLIGKKWTLIAAKQDDRVNAMTASWGGLGVIWNKDVATIYVRPQRYTKQFIDQSDTFSLTFFPEEYRNMLSYMGTTSGKDEDKIAHEHLHIAHELETPYFEEASMVMICKKLYAQELKPKCFIEADLDEKNYPNKDYHTMYIGEIIKILVKEK